MALDFAWDRRGDVSAQRNALRHVNRRWFYVVEQRPAFWTTLEPGPADLVKMSIVLSRDEPIRIQIAAGTPQMDVFTFLGLAMQVRPRWEEVDITNRAALVFAAVAFVDEAQSLRYARVGGVPGGGVQLRHIPRGERLSHITLTDIAIQGAVETPISGWGYVTHMELTGVGFTAVAIVGIVRGLPRLQTLVIQQCHLSSPELPQATLQEIPAGDLRCLRLHSANMSELRTLLSTLQARNLRYMTIDGPARYVFPFLEQHPDGEPSHISRVAQLAHLEEQGLPDANMQPVRHWAITHTANGRRMTARLMPFIDINVKEANEYRNWSIFDRWGLLEPYHWEVRVLFCPKGGGDTRIPDGLLYPPVPVQITSLTIDVGTMDALGVARQLHTPKAVGQGGTQQWPLQLLRELRLCGTDDIAAPKKAWFQLGLLRLRAERAKAVGIEVPTITRVGSG